MPPQQAPQRPSLFAWCLCCLHTCAAHQSRFGRAQQPRKCRVRGWQRALTQLLRQPSLQTQEEWRLVPERVCAEQRARLARRPSRPQRARPARRCARPGATPPRPPRARRLPRSPRRPRPRSSRLLLARGKRVSAGQAGGCTAAVRDAVPVVMQSALPCKSCGAAGRVRGC